MKVKELKELLANVADDTQVSFLMDAGCCGEYEEMECYDTETYDNTCFILRLNTLPGYRSCIQWGSTKRADEEWLKKHRKGK